MGRRKKELSGKIGVYQIVNLITNRRYIGSSEKLNIRLNQHKSDLKNNRHSSYHLQVSCNKYGIENFVFEVIEFCSIDLLMEREQFWIDSYSFRQLYNARIKAESNRGWKYTEEQRNNLIGRPPNNIKEPIKVECGFCKNAFLIIPSRQSRAKYCSKNCMNKNRKGVNMNIPTQFKKGMIPVNKGIPMSEEIRLKVSNSLKGRVAWNKGLKKIA